MKVLENIFQFQMSDELLLASTTYGIRSGLQVMISVTMHYTLVKRRIDERRMMESSTARERKKFVKWSMNDNT